ncbi:hypothetical protein [Alkaliphilus transvaalensis]|uniref:hypothetical protein n=1 Tax=Alkaliphilus transvaalensis TaxID=114628 RepID=UPI00047D49AF|nr:hypothetical protein [Alkaliphilus transvaalensis]
MLSFSTFKKITMYMIGGFAIMFMFPIILLLLGFNGFQFMKDMDNIERLRICSIMAISTLPIGALLIYSFKFAAIPLFKDFIKGSLRHKLIIILIVISLLMLKLGEYR